VFRIVQETLTNVVKHAPGARASVTIDVVDHEVHIETVDSGSTSSQLISNGRERIGHGIVGMRERTGAFGGALIAEPVSSDGFRVSATIPFGRPT
jgi:signal transduction histidine kinase